MRADWLRGVVWAAALVLIGAAMTAAALWYDMETLLETPVYLPDDVMTFTIARGDTVSSVAGNLSEAGVLDRPLYVRIDARWRGIAGRLQAGEYLIETGLTPREILDKFVRGDVRRFAVTIPEGLRFAEIRARLAEHPDLIATLTGLSDAEVLAQLTSEYTHPEGLVFPDTYFFNAGARDIDILQRAFQRMQSVLAEHWLTRDAGLPFDNRYEALTLASIVEKETGVPEERPIIAGVLVRRLQLGMRLQVDPTVIYGLRDGFDGDLTRADLALDTPYNTYVRFGLPPTPIAMPGAEAIAAVLHPQEGDALYFVARGDGSHHFSATLEEHNRAVARFQLRGQ